MPFPRVGRSAQSWAMGRNPVGIQNQLAPGDYQSRRDIRMPVDALHSEYESFLTKWLRAREVIAGEDSIKAAGERYLPRLYESPFTDFSPKGVDGVFESKQVDKLISLLTSVRERAIA